MLQETDSDNLYRNMTLLFEKQDSYYYQIS